MKKDTLLFDNMSQAANPRTRRKVKAGFKGVGTPGTPIRVTESLPGKLTTALEDRNESIKKAYSHKPSIGKHWGSKPVRLH